MFNKRKINALFDSGHAVTLIGSEAYFQGTLTAKGSLRIDGRLEGSIVDAQSVVIGESGKVNGDLSAETVTVSGEVKGNITAGQSIELLAKSRVHGDVRTPKIVIEETAIFDGHCAMSTHSGNVSAATKYSKTRLPEEK